jgi:hypothetical protein
LNKIILAEGKEGGPIRLLRRLAREKGIPVQVSPKEALDRLEGGNIGLFGFANDLPTRDHRGLNWN